MVLFRITLVLLPGVTGLVLKLTDVPEGTPAIADKVIGLLKPPAAVVPRFTDMVAGAGQFAVAGLGVVKEKPVGNGTVAVQIPRPCVPAAIVRSDARYLIISVLTVGKEGLGVHTVLAPLILSVSHTPVSVAI